jgi:hypothetical protein
MRTMDLGSWFTQSSISIYGDDHVIDNRSKYNCHVLMINLWRLYVLKHIVERSTHMSSGVTPKCGQVTPPLTMQLVRSGLDLLLDHRT